MIRRLMGLVGLLRSLGQVLGGKDTWRLTWLVGKQKT